MMPCQISRITANRLRQVDRRRPHGSALGLADVVAPIDAHEGPPKKRGPYKPRELAAASRLMNGDALYRHRAGCLDRATQGRKEYMWPLREAGEKCSQRLMEGVNSSTRLAKSL